MPPHGEFRPIGGDAPIACARWAACRVVSPANRAQPRVCPAVMMGASGEQGATREAFWASLEALLHEHAPQSASDVPQCVTAFLVLCHDAFDTNLGDLYHQEVAVAWLLRSGALGRLEPAQLRAEEPTDEVSAALLAAAGYHICQVRCR